MFRFENEYVLYALFLIPVLVAAYVWLRVRAKKKWAAYGELALLEKLFPERSVGREHLKFTLLMLALAAFIFALANPQVGSSLEKGKRQGVDIMVCLDISNSMLAEDIQPNRLEAAKMAMARFIDKLSGDRIGLVVFAGNAFVQLPITSDYAAAKMFLNYVQPEMMNEQGTDIAAALDLATVSMLPEDMGNEDNQKINALTSKVILVVSDGEDHSEEAVSLTKQIRDGFDVTIHTIGIGSTRGEPIPVRSANGNVSYKKDAEGNTVMSRLNEEVLQDIAAFGGGVYVHATNASMGFEAVLDKINAMTKTELDEVTFARYESKFQIPLLLGLCFLFLEMLLFATKSKSKWKEKILKLQGVFRTKTPLLLLLFISLAATLNAQTNEELSAIRKGNDKFKKAEKTRNEAMQLQEKGGNVNALKANDLMKKAATTYQEAEVLYRKAMQTTKNYDKANYNLGTSLYRQEKYEEAGQYFKNVAEQTSSDKQLRAKSYHNLGNSLMKQENYGEAVEAYKKSLKLQPSDMDTKYNLEYAKKKLQQQQQQQQQNQGGGQDQQDQQNQQDQQQNQGGGQNDKQDQQQNQQQNGGQNDKQDQQQKQQQNGDKNDKQDQQKQQQQAAADKQKRQDEKRQLDALQQNERQTQQKVKQQEMQRAPKSHQDMDW